MKNQLVYWRRIGIDHVYAEYKDNEIAADQKYEGRLIGVSGEVADIAKTFGRLYIVLQAGALMSGVQAFFPDKEARHLARLHKGDEVELVCRGDRLAWNVILTDCRVYTPNT